MSVGRDITEKIKLQDQLIQAQKMESIGRLAGGVAHDFNNMLSVIIGQTELLLYQCEEESSIRSSLKEIQNAGHKSAGLTRRLLAFARKQTISPQIIELNEAVSGILKMLQRLIGETIALDWHPCREVCPVMIDPSQLDQVLTNLCVNARDAIGDKGRVTIETDIVFLDQDTCQQDGGCKPGTYVTLCIADDGCGMDEITMKHIFEPFYTTKKEGEGTGLGLATIYGIVRQNNGFISVDSEIDKGTTFTISLPLKSEDGLQEDNHIINELEGQGSETILLVEDEVSILRMTRVVLERLGYTVISINSPLEAVEKAKKYPAKIDLLFTDVIMPEMNGRELAAKLKLIKPEIKVLYMSGYTANIIARQGVLIPEVVFIEKPFSIKELAPAVRKALKS